MTQKNLLLLLAKLVPDGKMFGKGESFADSAEMSSLSSWEFFVQRCIMIIIRGNLSSNVSKLLWEPFFIVIYSSQVVQEISVQKNDVWKTVAIVANLWLLLLYKTWPRWSVWSKKTHELQKIR